MKLFKKKITSVNIYIRVYQVVCSKTLLKKRFSRKTYQALLKNAWDFYASVRCLFICYLALHINNSNLLHFHM